MMGDPKQRAYISNTSMFTILKSRRRAKINVVSLTNHKHFYFPREMSAVTINKTDCDGPKINLFRVCVAYPPIVALYPQQAKSCSASFQNINKRQISKHSSRRRRDHGYLRVDDDLRFWLLVELHLWGSHVGGSGRTAVVEAMSKMEIQATLANCKCRVRGQFARADSGVAVVSRLCVAVAGARVGDAAESCMVGVYSSRTRRLATVTTIN